MLALHTDRLSLRGWEDDDADFVFDMYSRWQVKQFVGRYPTVMSDRGEAEAAIARWRSLNHPTLGIWAVQDRHDSHLLGTLLLKPIPASSDEEPPPDSGDIEIGWHFHPDAWGHGYATEAAARVLQHAFAGGLAEVVAVTHAPNTASQAVARRIGMTHRGQTDRYYDMTCELFTAAPLS